jgi:hypothetical protein
MQTLYLVIGGELVDLSSTQFRDPSAIDVVGVFVDKSEATSAWRANAQRTVDNALMRYFVLPISDAQQKKDGFDWHGERSGIRQLGDRMD